MKATKQILSALLALVMLLGCMVVPAAAAPATQARQESELPDQSIRAEDDVVLEEDAVTINPGQEVEILVRLEQTPEFLRSGDLEKAVAAAPALQTAQDQAVAKIETALDADIAVENSYTLLFNGFSFTGEYWMLEEINKIDGMRATIPMEFALIEGTKTTELSPSTGTSTGLTGAVGAWELGYTGEGMIIAVVDTGILATHEAFSVMPESGRMDKEYLQNVYARFGDRIHAGTAADVDSVYISEKLPFNWDYFGNDADAGHVASDHGTHVAGIAAGNNGEDFKGIAPNAQIVTMQIFNDDGGASWATLLCALEDCVYLGVDVINMSLGSVAGSTSYASVADGFEEVYTALEDAGISVAVAAGNDGSSLTWTNYGDWYSTIYQGLASNPDVGLVNAPATLPGSFGVASVVNSTSLGYISAYGQEFFCNAVTGIPSVIDLVGEHEVVYVGLASVEEIAALDVEGKIAIAQRGILTFDEKCENLDNAGALGVILFNNVSGVFEPFVTYEFPLGTLTMDEGERLVSLLPDGVNGTISVVNAFNTKAIKMAIDSAWGSTADLSIKPEIAAPGDGITSAIGFGSDNDYESWSGTSMATPHVAAGLALIRQHLQTMLPEADAKEINELAYAFAMSTAHQVSGFVRQQGAGILDVAAAVSSEVYLSVKNNSRPKLELGESEDGVFRFSFDINNLGDTAHTYTVVPSVLTENVFDYEYYGPVEDPNPEGVMVKLINGTTYDVTDQCNITAPKTVTVPAGGSVTVEMTIACSDALMAYFEENCASGMFLEGFIHLEESGEAPVDLSIPFLGFVGDWDYASMLDRGYYWQEAVGEMNYQQLSTSKANFVGYMTEQGLGINQYADMTGKTYLADRNAISPNGDGVMDAVTYFEFTLLRSPKTVKAYVQDGKGNVLKVLYDQGDYTYSKDYWTGPVNGGDTYCTLLVDFAAEELKENETVYVVLETWLDHEGYDPAKNESGRWVIPVTKDLTVPTVKAVKGGIEISDTNYVAYYAIYADEAKTELLYETGVFAEERGATEFYATEEETFYVAVADYAGNEQFYLVDGGQVEKLDIEAFDYGRTIVGLRSKDYGAGIYDYDWVSFRSELPEALTDLDILPEDYEPTNNPEEPDLDLLSAAVTADGTLYACDMHNLYLINPDTFERLWVCSLDYYPGENWTTGVKNISVDPGTDELYAWVATKDLETRDTVDFLVHVDLTTGELTEVFMFDDSRYWGIAMCFVGDGVIALYDHRSYYIVLLDLEGNILEFIDPMLWDPIYGSSYLGKRGYCADMVYDEGTNAIYLLSDWVWFHKGRYDQGGMVKFDFDTMTATMSGVGNGGGSVVHSLYFADEVAEFNDVDLVDFTLDQTKIDLLVSTSATINATMAPLDATMYSMKWETSDPAVATVGGVRDQATIVGMEEGTAIITATASDAEGNVIAVKSVEVTVSYDEELLKALNVEGSRLKFLSNGEYPFVPVMDEETGRYYAASSCGGVVGDGTNSTVSLTMDLRLGDKITFDYFVSSEKGWDMFYFHVNGEQILSGSGNMGWNTYTYDVVEDATYTLEWSYQKDYSADSYKDLVGVDNVELTPTKRDDVIAMIEAIGEVTLDSGEAIAAARDGYEALNDLEKKLIYNYGALLEAERAYVALLAENAALYEAKFYALEIVHAMEGTDTSGYCAYRLMVFEAALAAAKEAINTATNAAEIDAALAALYAAVEAAELGCPAAKFTDVDRQAWYHEGIDFVVDKGYMVGVSDTTFAPNAKLTRGQIVTILYRIAGEPSVEGMENPFADVAEDTWYTDAVIWAANSGVVNGITETTFAPGAAATREQFVTILYRYNGGAEVDTAILETFADGATVAEYAVEAMAWAVDEGILTGMSATTLAPRGTATRAQIATIMMRYLAE